MVESPKIGTKEFGDLLRTAREHKGMSRNDLVEATGLSYPYISQLETAYRKPSPAAIQKLADALDISLDEIFAAMTKPAGQALSIQQADSGWIANQSYADSPPAVPAPMGFTARGPAPAPQSQSRAVPAAARSASGGGPKASSPSVVQQAVRLITQLPAEQRLDALAKVQSQVVESVIDDGIRQGRSTS